MLLKYKSVSRLLGLCLGTRIFKIRPPVQKLAMHKHFFVTLVIFFLVRTSLDKIDR